MALKLEDEQVQPTPRLEYCDPVQTTGLRWNEGAESCGAIKIASTSSTSRTCQEQHAAAALQLHSRLVPCVNGFHHGCWVAEPHPLHDRSRPFVTLAVAACARFESGCQLAAITLITARLSPMLWIVSTAIEPAQYCLFPLFFSIIILPPYQS